jgi:hypothetical protein
MKCTHPIRLYGLLLALLLHELTRAYLGNWMRYIKHSTRSRRGNGK